MPNEIAIINESDLKSKIYVIHGVQVMLDMDLAEIYGYETKRFNEQVKNNIERFDDDFRFQLTDKEVKDLRSKISTTNTGQTHVKIFCFKSLNYYLKNAQNGKIPLGWNYAFKRKSGRNRRF